MAFNAASFSTSATITNAELQAILQFVRAVLNSSGMVQATGVGTQIDPTTATFPGTNSTVIGYEIWKFNDAQQGSYPIWMKLSWRRGSTAAVLEYQAILASGFDSSGNATGTTFFDTGTTTVQPILFNTATTRTLVCSAGSYYFFLKPIGLNTHNVWLAERSVDAAGATTNKGMAVMYADGNPTVSSQFIYYAAGSQPASEPSTAAYGSALMPANQANGLLRDGTNPAIYPQYWQGLGECFVSSIVGMIFNVNCTLNTVNTGVTILGTPSLSIYPRAANETQALNFNRNTNAPSSTNCSYYVRAD